MTPRSYLAQAAMAASFFRQQRTPAQCGVDGVVRPVELQENRSQPGVLERGDVGRIAGEAQAVGVHLDEVEAQGAAQRHDGGQVVAQRRLAAGKLHVARPSAAEYAVIPAFDGRQVGVSIPNLTGFLKPVRFGAGETERAAQVAALRHFEERGAGLLAVVRAKAAVEGAAAFHLGEGRFGRRGDFGAHPGLISRFTTPKDRLEDAVRLADFGEVDIIAAPDAIGRDARQTFGADAFGGGEEGFSMRKHMVHLRECQRLN